MSELLIVCESGPADKDLTPLVKDTLPNLFSSRFIHLVRFTTTVSSHLELVADADEAEFSRPLLHVFAVVGVFKELSDEAVLGLADQTLQRHVQGVVVLLHKLGLAERHNGKQVVRLRRVLLPASPTTFQVCLVVLSCYLCSLGR